MSELLETLKENHEKLMTNEDYCFLKLSEIIMNEDTLALAYYASKGYEMNPRNNIYSTPLLYLNEKTSVDFVKLLKDNGMNMHAIDIFGTNVLMGDCIDSKELVTYFLSIGLNPYQEDFDGLNILDVAEEDWFDFTEEEWSNFISKYSLHSEVFSRRKALEEKNFPLALKVAEHEIVNLGGLDKLLSSLKLNVTRDYLQEIYFIFLLNKKYEEAFSLMRYITDISVKYGMTNWNDYPFYYDAAFIIGDKEAIVNAVHANREKCKQYALDKSNLLSYIMLLQFESVDVELMKLLEKEVYKLYSHKTGCLSRIAQLFTINNPVDLEYELGLFENSIEKELSIETIMTKYFFLGWFYLNRKDFINAEYMFNKCRIIGQKESQFSLSEYAQSHAMIDYIRMKNEGN